MPKNASEKDIKTAHRKLVKQHHPDVKNDDPLANARFIRIQVGAWAGGGLGIRAEMARLISCFPACLPTYGLVGLLCALLGTWQVGW